MEELNLFIPRARVSRFVSRPTEGGISPINELLYISRFCRLGIRLTESRILPEKRFSVRRRSFNLERNSACEVVLRQIKKSKERESGKSRPVRSFKVIGAEIQEAHLPQIANLIWDFSNHRVFGEAQVSKLCQAADLWWNYAGKPIGGEVQESEASEVAKSSWYGTVEMIPVEVESGEIQQCSEMEQVQCPCKLCIGEINPRDRSLVVAANANPSAVVADVIEGPRLERSRR
ncbi:hypothetical protein SASPL_136779 [Salvia splendens]|uniref:Uncharacterized protein n=1 Tax=Salvia splendens TaxID=180675 RepID=A0A8X8X0I5_SALSN|nr:hypothetical protein SASPL_136779 [Salvia splendens]